ncbi:universal stress protein [Halococcus sp. IIIV-5B]|uniref:universal stress protein n=1 Tax=Halococcus sp. IIIV-5B TaxID=2321230 RepID=UPI000E720856|nr:universal stress protein [Halococcus sp. IIIV-5B]RJT07908.1 universal stress protein [Halococcus sp. IIIV-5B]
MAILTVIDINSETKPVLSVGNELANTFGEEQVILQVISDSDDEMEMKETIEKRVRDDIGEIDDTTIEIDKEPSFWEVNDPAERVASQVTDRAEEIDANYIVVGSRKRSPAGKAILGSVAQKVLLNSAAPVVIADQSGE